MTSTANDLKGLITSARANQTYDMVGEVFDLAGQRIDERVLVAGVKFRNFQVKNGELVLRAMQGWSISNFDFDNATLGMLGGVGCSITDGTIHDTQSMAQLQIAWDDVFGRLDTPAAWIVQGVTLARNSMDAPASGSTAVQNHGIYCHTIQDTAMHGKIVDCTFSDHPNGSNLKLGGTNASSGFARDIDVSSCRFTQRGGRGGNITLVSSTTAKFEDCTPVENTPERVLTANGPAQASFARSPFKGIEVATMSKKIVTQNYWFFGPRSFTYQVPWYVPHSELTSAPAGTNLEGISWL